MQINLRMRSKILLLCLGSTLIALVLQTLLFQDTSSKLIYNQAREESFNYLQNMQNDVYAFVKNIENNLIDIYSERELIQALVNEDSIGDLRDIFYREAYNIAETKFSTTDSVVCLYLYNPDHQIISTYRRAVTPKHNYQTNIYDAMEEQNAEIVMQYVESDDTTMCITSYYNPYRETDIVRFVLKLYRNSSYEDKIGYVVCDVDSKALKKIVEKYSMDHSMIMWLQPTGDRPILTTGELDNGERKYYEEIVNEVQNGSENQEDTSVNARRVFFKVPQTKYNINAYSLMPQYLLEQNQKTLTKNLLLIALLMIGAAVPITVFITSTLTKPLDKLMQTIEKIKGGNTQLRADICNKDEIGDLGQSFNEMLDQIQVLVKQEYETGLLLNQAEYKALQAQINPHFLYNTLDTMSSIADIQECHEVSSLSKSLSDIFRYSLDMKNPFSTVAKEIMHLKNYIYVMDVRMRNQVQYHFDIDDSVLQDTLPRISIQPLVENAINHGLRNFRGKKEIRIQATQESGNLVILVADNGIGMDGGKVNKMLEENNTEYADKGTSIGLHNINSRMKLLYGEEFGIHIESEVGEGTKVFLTIPRVKMEEIDSWIKNPIRSYLQMTNTGQEKRSEK